MPVPPEEAEEIVPGLEGFEGGDTLARLFLLVWDAMVCISRDIDELRG